MTFSSTSEGCSNFIAIKPAGLSRLMEFNNYRENFGWNGISIDNKDAFIAAVCTGLQKRFILSHITVLNCASCYMCRPSGPRL